MARLLTIKSTGVILLLDSWSFEEHFIGWAAQGLRLGNGTVINVDGKKLRGSATQKEQRIVAFQLAQPPQLCEKLLDLLLLEGQL